jgi:hypothetical protein
LSPIKCYFVMSCYFPWFCDEFCPHRCSEHVLQCFFYSCFCVAY